MKKSVFQMPGENASRAEKTLLFFVNSEWNFHSEKLEEKPMIDLMKLPVRRGNTPLRIAKGHFVTNHSHINYYIDITYQKTRLSEAKDTAYHLVSHFINDTPVDTIL